jgi:hypothetical protein
MTVFLAIEARQPNGAVFRVAAGVELPLSGYVARHLRAVVLRKGRSGNRALFSFQLLIEKTRVTRYIVLHASSVPNTCQASIKPVPKRLIVRV